MANKKNSKKDNGLMAQAKVVNKVALAVGEEIVDFGLKGAETSQRVFGKVLEGGVTLLGMQQKMALDTLEEVMSNKRFKSLVKLPIGYFNKFMDVAEERVDNIRNEAADVLEEVREKVDTKTNTSATTKAKKSAKKAKLKKVTTVTTTKEEEVVIEKDDLTKIKGIGPKAAGILTKAGYGSFLMIAKASKTELEKVLEGAGSRYASMNPTPWIAEAKKLANKK